MPRVLEKYNMKDLGSARAIKILMEENASLKNALPTAHISTTSTQLTDSAEDLPIEHVKIKGATSQIQYNGYNLCKPIATDTKNDMTLTNNGDGSYTLNGTSTSNTSFYITGLNYPAGEYTINANNPVLIDNGAFYIQAESSGGNIKRSLNEINAKVTQTTTNSITAWSIVIPSGLTLNNFVIKPMLESGSTAHDWEPYVDGQPAPNPNYKSDIHRATGECNEKFVNKNLFDKSLFSVFSTELQYITLTLQPNTTYTMSSNLPAWTGVGSNLFFMKDGDSPSTATNGVKPDTAITLTTDSTGIVKIGYRDGGNTLTHETTNYLYQIEVGSTASDYVPHAEQNAPLSLGNIELCQIGDYQDYIYKENGNWYKHNTIKKYIFDGSENWIPVNNSENARNVGLFTTFELQDIKYYPSNGSIIPAMCSDQYISKPNYNYADVSRTRADFTISTIYGNIFYLQNGNFSDYTNEQVKNAMIGTILYYPLETPTTTQITDATLVNQLNNLLKLKTYKDITNIESSGTALAPVLDCDYYKSISSLEDRIEILEAQVALLEE